MDELEDGEGGNSPSIVVLTLPNGAVDGCKHLMLRPVEEGKDSPQTTSVNVVG